MPHTAGYHIDSNQTEIVKALRGVGCTVLLLHAVGQGCPDVLCGTPRGDNVLLEIKSAKGKLDAKQVEWHQTWRGPVYVVRSVAEAFAAVGIEEIKGD